jgi:heat shock protein HtpX
VFKNTLKTFTLLTGFAGSFILIGSLLGGLTGLVIGAVLGFGLVGSSYWFSDRLAVRFARAEEVRSGQLEWLQSDLAVLAERAGMRGPRLFLSPNAQPNALATGRNEQTAVVCVTEGLRAVLDREEVRGVVAHEVAHVRHRDILIGSIAAAVATGISMIANLAMFASMFGGRSDDDDAPNPLVVMDIAPAQANIVNPLAGRNVKFSNLFLTHPPTEARIAALLTGDNVLVGQS